MDGGRAGDWKPFGNRSSGTRSRGCDGRDDGGSWRLESHLVQIGLGKNRISGEGIYIVAYGVTKREQRRSFRIERSSTGFIVPLMEDTLQTWLFIIEVAASRNNVSLLHVRRCR